MNMFCQSGKFFGDKTWRYQKRFVCTNIAPTGLGDMVLGQECGRAYKKKWWKPTFARYLLRSKSAMEVGRGIDRAVQNSFKSNISLSILAYGDVELMGDSRADNKSSLDSAALLMPYEL
ncbi:hypothetical protein Tco_0916494 [Tanacetum coccineum]